MRYLLPRAFFELLVPTIPTCTETIRNRTDCISSERTGRLLPQNLSISATLSHIFRGFYWFLRLFRLSAYPYL